MVYLCLLEFGLFLYACDDLRHVGLKHHPAHHQLSQDKVHLQEQCHMIYDLDSAMITELKKGVSNKS